MGFLNWTRVAVIYEEDAGKNSICEECEISMTDQSVVSNNPVAVIGFARLCPLTERPLDPPLSRRPGPRRQSADYRSRDRPGLGVASRATGQQTGIRASLYGPREELPPGLGPMPAPLSCRWINELSYIPIETYVSTMTPRKQMERKPQMFHPARPKSLSELTRDCWFNSMKVIVFSFNAYGSSVVEWAQVNVIFPIVEMNWTRTSRTEVKRKGKVHFRIQTGRDFITFW